MRQVMEHLQSLLDEPQRIVPAGKKSKLTVVKDVLPDHLISVMIRRFDRDFYPVLSNMRRPIPSEAIAKMKESCTELLPKTVRVKTASLNPGRSAAFGIARKMGLLSIMLSDGLRQIGERLTGARLLPKPDCQVICYEAGDYSGPHNDHHPEIASARNGYVDIHLMLSNGGVDQQYLVYERRGYLSESINIACRSAIAGYRLPFWHYTTPLLAKEGQSRKARRWLLLASYNIAHKK